MSKKSDAALEASFGRRRAPEAIEADMATTTMGQQAEQVRAPQMIPLAQLKESKYQARELDTAHVASLAESIGVEGLLTPIIVRMLPPPEGGHTMAPAVYEIVAGHHRAAAMAKRGETAIPALVRTMSDVEAAAALTAENLVRKDLNDYELYKTIVMLREIEDVSTYKLARILDFARTKVQGLEAFDLLPKAAHDIMEKHPDAIGYNQMAKIKTYCESHPDLVVEGLAAVAAGEMKQTGLPGFIERRIANDEAKAADADEVSWKRHGVEAKFKYSDRGAKITGNLDYDKLRRLIEENLESLRRE